MKTTLFAALAALSPGFMAFTRAEESKPDAPREERREDAERGRGRAEAGEQEAGQREQRARAEEAAVRQEIEKHLKAAVEEAAKLEEVGKKEEAENMRREARERAQAAMAERERAMQERRRAAGEHGDGPRPDGPPRPELENKLKHVEQAIGHLREAGLPEPAEALNQVANRLRSALRGEGEPRREEARREEPRREEPRREEGRRDEPKREEPGREERREERRPDNDIEALRREIQELRQAVRQLSERKDH